MTPAIVSFDTTQVTPKVRELLEAYKPLGVIIMGYNIENKAQLSALCQALRTYVPHILIDQEGGAVRRLRGAEFFDAKDMTYFGALYDQEPQLAIAELVHQNTMVAQDLTDCYINVNCAPCLDLDYGQPSSEKHVISFYKRAFHKNPEVVGMLGKVVCQTFLENGITPVVKHLPGHGASSGADPHHGVCHMRASLDQDIVPFKYVTDMPVWGMTNHVIYDVYDAVNPTASSPDMVQFIRNKIGFKGLLMTDAIDMKALDHMTLEDKVTEALSAGHDAVLYCGGKVEEVEMILKVSQSYTTRGHNLSFC